LNTPDILARYRVLRVLVTLVTLVVAIYAIQLIWSSLVIFGDIIVEFFLAWLIAFMLDPIVEQVRRLRAPRPLAVAVVYLALAIVLTGLIILTVPLLGDQIRRLASEVVSTVTPENLSRLADNATLALERLGVKPRDAKQIVPQVSQQIPTYASQLSSNALAIGASAISSVLSLLFDAFIVIIISFYIMLDGGRIADGLILRLPPAWKPDAELFRGYVAQMFGGFLRAQLILSLIYGGFTWLMLAILGQANSFLVALVCGLLVILPFIGPFIAIAPPVVLVLLQSDPSQLPVNLAILLVGLFIAQQITFQVIAPRVFSSHLGVSPLLLIGALLIGAREGGVWGAFFAGPIVAIAYAMFEVFYQRFRRVSSLYPDVPDTPKDGDAKVGVGDLNEAREEQPIESA
jgi:predicted PurR-regulated permease PerM